MAGPDEQKSAASRSLSLDALKKAIPAECFEPDMALSFKYLAIDCGVWACAAVVYRLMLGPEMAWYASTWSLVLTGAYAVVAGLAMWCLFVVGHDCGHGSFSKSSLVNDVSGLFAHSLLLVPYFAWRLSHRRHHLHHNHLTDDYSFPWEPRAFTAPENISQDGELPEGWLANDPTPWTWVGAKPGTGPFMRLTYPMLGWAAYLWGVFCDGNHYFPFKNQRLWKTAPPAEIYKAFLSTLFVAGMGIFIFRFPCGGSISTFIALYGLPWIVFSFWLVTVTYLQHHNEKNTVVYDETTWGFVPAAFETIDRTYGMGIDEVTHHITDGHVVHHLFPWNIPHYHLQRATHALQAHLHATGNSHCYKHVTTKDFVFQIFSSLYNYGFFATLITTKENPHVLAH